MVSFRDARFFFVAAIGCAVLASPVPVWAGSTSGSSTTLTTLITQVVETTTTTSTTNVVQTTTTTSSTTTHVDCTTTSTLPPAPEPCADWALSLNLESSAEPLGALHVRIGYAKSSGGFLESQGEVLCNSSLADAQVAFENKRDIKELSAAAITVEEFSARTEVAECSFRGLANHPPDPSDFVLTIAESVNLAGEPVAASVGVSLTAVLSILPCSDQCGDGVVTGSEQCDDANDVDDDACFNDCTSARCGDGVVHAGVEECDDGNCSDADACLGSCVAAKCGDGVLRPALEVCDDGNRTNDDDCLNSCQHSRCGDGFIRTGLEACDDGNVFNTDTCTTDCKVTFCGDGFVRKGVEQCDDANPSNTDACLATCQLATCGDGFVRAGVESCDDGNRLDGDGCSSKCKVQSIVCGDATGEEEVTASDALRVLQRAVGIGVDCFVRACDVNADGKITALDSLMVLRFAVGLPVDLSCAQ